MPRFPFLKKTLTALFIFAITFSTQASSYPYCDSINSGMQHLLQTVSPKLRIGVVVQSMQTGRTYFSYNANKMFAPASVQKMFTVTAALINLTPNFRFATRVLTNGDFSNGVVHGDLIFQFNGDPTLTQNDVVGFVKQLQTMGVHRVTGNVVIDDTAFNHIPYPAGWLWNDLNSDFAAPLDSIIINRNEFGLSLIPNRPGERPTVVPHLPYGAATFINEAKTTYYHERNCTPLTIVSNASNEYLIRGCMSRAAGEQSRGFAIRNMQMFTRALLRELMEQHHIPYSGKIVMAKTPLDSTVLVQHESVPLSQIIVHLLKKSDNLYADALLKKMGEMYNHVPGSWHGGLRAEFLVFANDVGINLNNIHLIDGAGLSLYNSVTPNDIAQLLNYIEHNPMLKNTLIPALPIAGVDGTLIWRMPDLARGDRVHAKTGSMAGVSTLAGFVNTRHHGLMSFVIMVNNVPKNRAPSIVLENRIVEFLANARNC